MKKGIEIATNTFCKQSYTGMRSIGIYSFNFPRSSSYSTIAKCHVYPPSLKKCQNLKKSSIMIL